MSSCTGSAEVVSEVGPGASSMTELLALSAERERSRFDLASAGVIAGGIALAAAILSTGGARSPLVPLTAFPAMIAGTIGAFPLRVIGGSVALILVLLGLELSRPEHAAEPLPIMELAAIAGSGALLGALFLGRVRRRLESRLVTSEKEHAEAVRAIGERHAELIELAGALAHELKNPLSAVQGLASLLERKWPDDEEVRSIAGEVRAASASVQELLDFSRPVSESALKRIPIAPLIGELSGVTPTGDAGAAVLAEPRKLSAVVVGLSRTAARGGAPVSFKVSRDKDLVHIEVSSGARSGGDDTRALAIASVIAEQHGAKLELSNGTAFAAVISWPAAGDVEAA